MPRGTARDWALPQVRGSKYRAWECEGPGRATRRGLGRPLGAGCPQLTDGTKTGVPVLQLEGTEFCQHPSDLGVASLSLQSGMRLLAPSEALRGDQPPRAGS